MREAKIFPRRQRGNTAGESNHVQQYDEVTKRSMKNSNGRSSTQIESTIMQSKEHATFKCFALGFLLACVIFNYPTILSRGKRMGNITAILSKGNDGDERNLNHEMDEESFLEDGQVTPDTVHSVTSINLIGERHHATKWITTHLEDCFGDQVEVLNRYTRWKHWFQDDDDAKHKNDKRAYHLPKSSLVVAMFRDPYDWVESMRERPYHSPSHFELDWKEFVTTPWTIERGPADKQLIASGTQYNVTCEHRFSFDEVIPCSHDDRFNMFNGTWHGKPSNVGVMYELNHDGSGRPYESIIDLRRDKIKQFLEVASFEGVAAFLPVQFEYVVTRGTSDLIDEIEKLTGFQANCKRAPPHALTPKDLDDGYIAWMNEHVDWEVEELVGYSKRDPMSNPSTENASPH